MKLIHFFGLALPLVLIKGSKGTEKRKYLSSIAFAIYRVANNITNLNMPRYNLVVLDYQKTELTIISYPLIDHN